MLLTAPVLAGAPTTVSRRARSRAQAAPARLRRTCCSAVVDVSVSEAPQPSPTDAESFTRAKARLLATVAGLDRGSAATASDRAAVDAAVADLEALAREAAARTDAGAAQVAIDERIGGKWRLVYSSTFAGVPGGSQGFTGAPGAGTPVRLGAVYQRVLPGKKRLDNIVELTLPGPLLIGSFTITACLGHTLEVLGESRVRITFDDITFRGRGVRGARPLTLPSPLRALGLEGAVPASLRGGEFDTTFVDGEARVSRGDRGELRVFVRA